MSAVAARPLASSVPLTGWRPNPGYCPPDVRGKRIRVRLSNGEEGRCDDNPMSPPGWAADTCLWRIDPGYPFNIAEFEVIA